ncbi:MAG: hypothetical protein ACLPVY_12895 [Acidimicrobiia bacterium]
MAASGVEKLVMHLALQREALSVDGLSLSDIRYRTPKLPSRFGIRSGDANRLCLAAGAPGSLVGNNVS